MKTLIALSASVVAVAAIAFVADMHIDVGAEAPTFVDKAGPDGTKYSLAKLTAEKPAFVVFWKQRCPHNPGASKIYNKLATTYKDKVNFVGFVNTDETNAKAWSENFRVQYPLLADSEKELIKAYGLKASICAFQIGTDGKVAAVYPGYGKESINNLNADMAKVAGMDAASLDGIEVPAGLTWG